MLGNKVAYIIFLILAGVFAIFYNNYFTGILFLVILLIPVILYLILSGTASHIKVELLPGNTIIKKGETERIILVFINKSNFPLNRILIPIQYVNEVTGVKRQRIVELALDQQCKQKIRIDLSSNHCGNIHIIIKKIILFDFLHIWKKRKKLSLHKVITVVPQIHDTGINLINKVYTNDASVDSEKYSKEKKGEDVSEVFEIRDYRRGDKPNRIHWKLSQKLDQVMIKEFSEPLKDSIAFLLYPYCKEKGEVLLHLVDGFLESIITLSNSCLRGGKIHTMMWYDASLEQYRDMQLNKAEDMYLAVQSLLKSPILTEYRPVMKDFMQLPNTEYTGIFFITTSLEKENLEYLLYQSKLTFCVLIFVNDLNQISLSQEIKQELYKYQIPYYEIHINNMEESFLNMLERNLNVAE